MKSMKSSAAVLDQAHSLYVEDLALAYGDRVVLRDVSLQIPGGHTLALLGPSGCGKTSLLRAVAGLEVPMAGKIKLEDRVLFDEHTLLSPEKRHIGMVFQDLALFPHLSVAGNVAYGLKNTPNKKQLVSEALGLVNLSGYENRRISTLSGGQQQRVALARALAPKPRVLLLDEPFASLDEPTRVELRGQIHQLLTGLETTAVYVTHNQEEAFILGDEVAVMNLDGQIEQQGSPTELYTQPVSRWIADFVGSANLIEGVSNGTAAMTRLGEIPLLNPAPPDGAKLSVLIRPENLQFEAGSQARIELLEYYGHDTLYLLKLNSFDGDDYFGASFDGAGSREENKIWARSSTSSPLYKRGAEVSLKYTGPPAISFASKAD